MQIDKSNYLDILNKYDLRPSKDKGQNYLIDPSICSRIADSNEIKEDDVVLEIGPGIGSLTHFINEKTNKLTIVDIDKNSCEMLKDYYKNINIINEDIFKINISTYNKIYSNVPYNITSDLLEFVLLESKYLDSAVFMIQEEAYRRIISQKGKDYGPLSILINSAFEVRSLFKVSKQCFYPQPNCVSMVFKLTKVSTPLDKKSYQLIKKLFLNRRKTIFNNLSSAFGKDKSKEILYELNIPLSTRPEEINIETYLKLVLHCKN